MKGKALPGVAYVLLFCQCQGLAHDTGEPVTYALPLCGSQYFAARITTARTRVDSDVRRSIGDVIHDVSAEVT